MNNEVWKKVSGYEQYEISNLGRLRKGNKILKQYFNDKGYLYVSLSKKINQYDLEGNFIRTWNSIKEACEELKNTHIRDVLKGRRKSALKSYWKYVDEV